MHSLSVNGSLEPPLSPPTIGRPSLVELPRPEAITEDERELAPVGQAEDAFAERRVVVRLIGGDEIEIAGLAGRDAAMSRARELVELFARAEADGEWPELDGRFLRPAAILAVDVLKAD
jgi:hypothetical protein